MYYTVWSASTLTNALMNTFYEHFAPHDMQILSSSKVLGIFVHDELYNL
jgi:hypothetical protein